MRLVLLASLAAAGLVLAGCERQQSYSAPPATESSPSVALAPDPAVPIQRIQDDEAYMQRVDPAAPLPDFDLRPFVEERIVGYWCKGDDQTDWAYRTFVSNGIFYLYERAIDTLSPVGLIVRLPVEPATNPDGLRFRDYRFLMSTIRGMSSIYFTEDGRAALTFGDDYSTLCGGGLYVQPAP